MSSKRNRTGVTARYPCPVCLGVQMAKLRPDPSQSLELDHCERCGGVWFDAGEVDLLRATKTRAVATTVKISDKAWRMQCHSCQASMSRADERCAACGWKAVLLCPVCQQALATVSRDGLRIDVCRRCRGAWFDNVELAEIWNRSVTAVARRHGQGKPPERFVDDYFLLDSLFWYPLFPYHASVPGVTLPDVAPSMDLPVSGGGDIGDLAGGIVDGTGEVAGGVFDWVADFFAGFDFS